MAQERTGNGGKKRYDPEVKKAVVEDALRTTIKAASESWGIPHGTVAYWYVRRGRKAEDKAIKRRDRYAEDRVGDLLKTLDGAADDVVVRRNPSGPGPGGRREQGRVERATKTWDSGGWMSVRRRV